MVGKILSTCRGFILFIYLRDKCNKTYTKLQTIGQEFDNGVSMWADGACSQFLPCFFTGLLIYFIFFSILSDVLHSISHNPSVFLFFFVCCNLYIPLVRHTLSLMLKKNRKSLARVWLFFLFWKNLSVFMDVYT